ncbi:MAG TPA: hypothetical protein PLQ91_05805 [Bacteroidales bacterium]|jgi:hypothetical protein|nr:hypothetical protein [Bacteroidales bacterium]HOC41173.1 hypothetical protein [Bacteroidales bacterium]HOJ24335.1 hypothetical protein [Bacteroidales bacterium]HPB20619.1 hypothetical protein [Bacteroidales bacterium]HPU47115.1 hypothetical protein [Bacteroidales bacterium]
MTKEELVQELLINTDIDTKLNILLESGVEILTLKKFDRFIKIYLVNNFYVELIYKYEINRITHINLIDTQDLIEKYQDYIKIVL